MSKPKKPRKPKDDEYHIDASTFQEPLIKLAEVIAQKLRREAGGKLRPTPGYVATDLHVLFRQLMYTYNCLFYLNADETRKKDTNWRVQYSIVTFPLVRNVIDSFYNITTILEDPRANGPWFRKYGYLKVLEEFDEEEKKYGGRPKWDAWIKNGRDGIDFQMRVDNFKKSDVLSTLEWPTFGKYVKKLRKGGVTTSHQDFLRTFLYGRWKEYSAMAHGGFDGLMKVAIFFIKDAIPHNQRDKVEESHEKIFSSHIGRAALVLLSAVTEVQAYFQFDSNGAKINERIHKIWSALMPIPEVKEIYKERYKNLMKNRGINP